MKKTLQGFSNPGPSDIPKQREYPPIIFRQNSSSCLIVVRKHLNLAAEGGNKIAGAEGGRPEAVGGIPRPPASGEGAREVPKAPTEATETDCPPPSDRRERSRARRSLKGEGGRGSGLRGNDNASGVKREKASLKGRAVGVGKVAAGMKAFGPKCKRAGAAEPDAGGNEASMAEFPLFPLLAARARCPKPPG